MLIHQSSCLIKLTPFFGVGAQAARAQSSPESQFECVSFELRRLKVASNLDIIATQCKHRTMVTSHWA